MPDLLISAIELSLVLLDDAVGALRHWQGLAGAMVGGFMGFVGAYMVHSSAKRRADVKAANLIVLDLTVIIELPKRVESLENDLRKEWQVDGPGLGLDADNASEFVNRTDTYAERLALIPRLPITPEIHDACALMMSIDRALGTALIACLSRYRAALNILDRIERQYLPQIAGEAGAHSGPTGEYTATTIRREAVEFNKFLRESYYFIAIAQPLLYRLVIFPLWRRGPIRLRRRITHARVFRQLAEDFELVEAGKNPRPPKNDGAKTRAQDPHPSTVQRR